MMRVVAPEGRVIIPGREPMPLRARPVRHTVPRLSGGHWTPLRVAPAPAPTPPPSVLRIVPSQPPKRAGWLSWMLERLPFHLPLSPPAPAARPTPELRPLPVRPPPVMRLRVTPAAATPPPAVYKPSTGYAKQVGILGSGQTKIAMTPADLLISPRTDITNFTVISLDAGQY